MIADFLMLFRVKFEVNNRFLVVSNYMCNSRIIGQYPNTETAEKAIEKDRVIQYFDGIELLCYYIVNVEHSIPYFSKLGKFKRNNTSDCVYVKSICFEESGKKYEYYNEEY